jgi:hypothetical protein
LLIDADVFLGSLQAAPTEFFIYFLAFAQLGPMASNGKPAAQGRKIDESGSKRDKIHESNLEVRAAAH